MRTIASCLCSRKLILPLQVAEIFKELLPAYAGAFQTVEFAILDKECLPDGNFQIFRSHILGDSTKIALQPRHANFRKMVLCDKLCPKLGCCLERAEDHRRDCWHPDMCLNPDCGELGDHALLWQHKQFCPDPNCKIVFGPKGTRTWARVAVF